MSNGYGYSCHISEWISTHGANWLTKLVEDYKINAVRDGNLVSLKYNQIESPMEEPIVQECRGMVVYDDGEAAHVMAHPYNKFFNLGEGRAAPIDWNTARVQEKLDGSLMILFFNEYVDEWQVASSGHPTAGGNYGSDSASTFREAFWYTWWGNGMHLPDGLEDICFMFELVGPTNRIVVQYDKAEVICHGARDMSTGKELTRETLLKVTDTLNWRIVKEMPLQVKTAEWLEEEVAKVNPMQLEGFIVVDSNCNRVKVKSPRYVALHHMRGEVTLRRVVELWKGGEVEELLAYFPEYKADVERYVNQIEQVCLLAYCTWFTHKDAPTRKDYALAVKDEPFSGLSFALLKEKEVTLEVARKVARGMADSFFEKVIRD